MKRRRRVLVACGTGIATSTHVADRLAREFAARNLDVSITQCRVTEIAAYADDVDVVVSTALLGPQFSAPVVSGVPFLTGIGEEDALEEVLRALGEERGET